MTTEETNEFTSTGQKPVLFLFSIVDIKETSLYSRL